MHSSTQRQHLEQFLGNVTNYEVSHSRDAPTYHHSVCFSCILVTEEGSYKVVTCTYSAAYFIDNMRTLVDYISIIKCCCKYFSY